MKERNFHALLPLLLAAVLTPLTALPVYGQDDPLTKVLEAQDQRIAAIEKAKRASISVFSIGGEGGGAGVVITPDGYALTNYHVVQPCGTYMYCSLPDGKVYDAVLVSIDPTGDVAMIKLLGRDDFPTAEMGDSDAVRVGRWCFAIGNPFLLATDFQPTVTYGIVSGVHRYQYPAGTLLEYTDCIQTDASINPGNSGGPLFNSQGELIGINGRGSFEKRGRVNVGVGYAISINQIKHFMGYLRSGRIVDHATLGATVSTDADGRVVVSNILTAKDAYRRGLRYGDEIVAFGGRSIQSVNAFKNVLGIFPKGWRVPLSYQRDGERFDIVVRLDGVHTTEELIAKLEGDAESENPIPDPAPKPKRDKKELPPDDQEDETPDEPPRRPDRPGNEHPPLPVPGAKMKEAKKAPEHLAKLIEEKRGYANYYFNQLNRARIWNQFLTHGDFASKKEIWRFFSHTPEGGSVEVAFGDHVAGGNFPEGAETIDFQTDLNRQLAPDGRSSFLLALSLWHRMLTLGPGGYGEVYYLGTMEIPGRTGHHDVIVAIHDVVESRFIFDPVDGHLVILEVFPDQDVDPCEIVFSDYREVDGVTLPFLFEVRNQNVLGLIVEVDQYELPNR